MTTPVALPEVAVWRKVTGDPESPSDAASVVWGPAVLPSVRVTDESPASSVTVEPSLTLPPPTGVQVIVTPEIGLPNASATRTTSGWGRGAPAGADCSFPDSRISPLADAATAVTVKATSTGAWLSGTTTRATPSEEPTVGPNCTAMLALPSSSVITVSGSGTAPSSSTTTVAPATGRPVPSSTWRMIGWGSISPTRPVCPSPWTRTMDAGSPSLGSTRSSPPQAARPIARTAKSGLNWVGVFTDLR